MNILGINYLSESSVCLVSNGTLKFAISEERLNRVKNWYGNPVSSFKHCLKENNLSLSNIDIISIHGTSSYKFLDEKLCKEYQSAIDEVSSSKLSAKDKNYLIKKIRFRKTKEKKAYSRNKKIIEIIKKKYKRKIEIFDHHLCHAASAAHTSGWKNCVVLTIDGYGDSASCKLFEFKNDKFKILRSTSILNSLGYFYGSITKYLGFKPQRHEGKVLGLAAYGNPNKAYRIIKKLIYFDKKDNNFKGGFKDGFLPLFENKYLNKILKGFSREDISAAAQRRLEEVVLSYIKSINKQNYKLALAGGVFANVKLNQKISQIKKIKEVYIFPNMGDGGLSVGAAALSYNKHTGKNIKKINNVYLGKKFSDSEIYSTIKKFNLKYYKGPGNNKIVAKKLHEGHVIALFDGRMEFGPRALGNRSILSRATDPKINKTLNRKLKRTEFMPFAPITLSKKFNEMYISSRKNIKASKYMTITLDCSKKMKRLSPAAIHIDGTARPQIIYRKENKKLYEILISYFSISKIPNLINTSFNMHEEPIVYSPHDAVRGFLDSRIDGLYIGNYLIFKD